MRKISLFLAMSLDGYLADERGGVDWLSGQDEDGADAQGEGPDAYDAYAEFAKTIDTVVMGWNTYHQIVTELSPNEWVYRDFTTYVVTHRAERSPQNIRFVNTDPARLVRTLREESGRDVWICGGAQIVQPLVREDLIDIYHITVIPTLLGSGIRLFENTGRERKLRLLTTRSYHGMTDLIYTRR